MTQHYPIDVIAERLAVDARRVRGWIRSGELPAIDVGPARGKHRRWRIAESDLELFLARRAHTPPAPPTRRRRRRDEAIIHFDYS